MSDRSDPPRSPATCSASRRIAAVLVHCALPVAAAWTIECRAADEFLDDAALRETLIGHTLRGKDWSEHYGAGGEIRGRGRHLGIRDYVGHWTVENGRVCYVYGHASFDTCSWLRRDGDRVTHHRRDGTLKKDGIASRQAGDRLDEFR